MAGKYRQTKEDRMHESHGMKKYSDKRMGRHHADHERRHPHEPATHHRERQGYREEMDSGYMSMLSEDHTAPSNMPQEVVHKYYGPCSYVNNYYLDDTIHGIDETNEDSIEKIERHQSDSMY